MEHHKRIRAKKNTKAYCKMCKWYRWQGNGTQRFSAAERRRREGARQQMRGARA